MSTKKRTRREIAHSFTSGAVRVGSAIVRGKNTIALSVCLAILVVFSLQVAAHAEDQQKAEKEVRKIAALALDPMARPLVSQTVAEFLKVPRTDLVRERRATNLNYGFLFVAHRLATSGTTLAGIATELQAGKTIWEVGNEQHADWRQIANDAKKLNDRIEAAFYNFFKDGHPDALRGSSDGYDAAKDSIAADQEGLTKQDIASAQDTYLRCFRRARGDGASRAEMPNERDHTPPQAEGDPR
jgi:hypothetical protein